MNNRFPSNKCIYSQAGLRQEPLDLTCKKACTYHDGRTVGVVAQPSDTLSTYQALSSSEGYKMLWRPWEQSDSQAQGCFAHGRTVKEPGRDFGNIATVTNNSSQIMQQPEKDIFHWSVANARDDRSTANLLASPGNNLRGAQEVIDNPRNNFYITHKDNGMSVVGGSRDDSKVLQLLQGKSNVASVTNPCQPANTVTREQRTDGAIPRKMPALVHFSELKSVNNTDCEASSSTNNLQQLARKTNSESTSINSSNCRSKKKFLCKMCGKIVSRLDNFKTHIITHGKERPYPCSEGNCKRRFNTKSELKMHLKWHKGRVFPCTNCNKSYATIGGLTYHMQDKRCKNIKT